MPAVITKGDTMKVTIAALLAAVIAVLVPTAVSARGGVYVDDVVFKNDGVTVFSESFDSGGLSGWYSAKDATLSPEHCYSPDGSLYENWHGGSGYASISHDIDLLSTGVLELSYRLWLPPASEQWNDAGGATVTNVYVGLYCNSTKGVYNTGLWLYPYDAQYRMYIGNQYQKYPSCSSGSWHSVVAILDPNAQGCESYQAQIKLDGTTMLTANYSGTLFPTVDRITIWSSFGDKQPVPEPSCVGIIAAGLAGMVLRRRSRMV